MNKFLYLPLLLLVSCALYAQDTNVTAQEEPKRPGKDAYVMSQMAVYSQGLPQPDGSLLLAEDFTYASEGIAFYLAPNDNLYISNGGNLFRFSAEKPGVALVQGVWNGYIDHFVDNQLLPYKYQPKKGKNLTFYCNKENTQYISLKMSNKPADCDGCDYVPPYDVVWHDDIQKKTKTLALVQDVVSAESGPHEYVLCQGNIFYYQTYNPERPAEGCNGDIIRAHHISSGKDEIFVSLPADKCGAKLSGPMAIPGTDYLLYQIAHYKTSNTQLLMKKGLK